MDYRVLFAVIRLVGGVLLGAASVYAAHKSSTTPRKFK